MNRLARITALSAQIDSTLNEFALAANAQGEYPWQTAQRERRNRRIAGAAVGAAAIGAGAYGAKKGLGALNNRYGTSGMDGVKAGAADLVNRADDAMKAGVAKVKGAVAPVMDPLKRKLAAGKLSYSRGVAQKQGMGKLVGRVARAVIHASRADDLTEFTGDFTIRDAIGSDPKVGVRGLGKPGTPINPIKKKKTMGSAMMRLKNVARLGRLAKLSRADHIIALEAKMDAALAEFTTKEDEKKSWPKNRVGLPAGSIAAGAAAYGADKAIMNRAKKKYGFTPTRATAYGEGVTEAMQSGKRAMKRGMAQAKYHAEPVVRKIKGALGLRKVAGLLK